MNPIVLTGALMGLTGVITGAAGAHMDGIGNSGFATAVRYHQMHAVLVLALGLTRLAPRPPLVGRLLDASAWVLVAGTVLFSATIYAATWFSLPWLTALTPFGGIGMLGGWAILILAAFRAGR